MAKYLVEIFRVAQANMKPAIATNLESVICIVRFFFFFFFLRNR